MAALALPAITCYATGDQTSDDGNVLTVYTIKCNDGQLVDNECVGGYWLTNHPIKYRVIIDQQVVVSWYPLDPAWPPERYDDCLIASLDHWICKYSDNSFGFGFRQGEYYSGDPFMTSEGRERERKRWGQIYVDEKRWLEVQEHGEEAILRHRSR